MSKSTLTKISIDALQFTFADRVRKALQASDAKAMDLADYLGVGRSSVSNWMNGHHVPRPRDIKGIAEFTGVPVEWLETGKTPTESLDGEGYALPRLDSNQQPAG